jgi:hypothetical protein
VPISSAAIVFSVITGILDLNCCSIRTTCVTILNPILLCYFCVKVMCDVSWVNRASTITQNPKVTAINTCIEVDLTGQVVSDSIGTRMYTGECSNWETLLFSTGCLVTVPERLYTFYILRVLIIQFKVSLQLKHVTVSRTIKFNFC